MSFGDDVHEAPVEASAVAHETPGGQNIYAAVSAICSLALRQKRPFKTVFNGIELVATEYSMPSEVLAVFDAEMRKREEGQAERERAAAEAVLEGHLDAERSRWQTRIEETIRRAGLTPCDPSGNESGDALDWSDDQIRRALIDAGEKAAAEAATGSSKCEMVVDWKVAADGESPGAEIECGKPAVASSGGPICAECLVSGIARGDIDGRDIEPLGSAALLAAATHFDFPDGSDCYEFELSCPGSQGDRTWPPGTVLWEARGDKGASWFDTRDEALAWLREPVTTKRLSDIPSESIPEGTPSEIVVDGVSPGGVLTLLGVPADPQLVGDCQQWRWRFDEVEVAITHDEQLTGAARWFLQIERLDRVVTRSSCGTPETSIELAESTLTALGVKGPQ